MDPCGRNLFLDHSVNPSGYDRVFLRFAFWRGDCLFFGLLTCVLILLGVLAASDMTLWIPLTISVVWLAIVMRWG